MLAIVILAAGSSSRLDRAKQLLVFDGVSLLEYAIKNAKQVSKKVVVVLGANFESITARISFPDVVVLNNTGWPNGISSSIRTSLDHLQNTKGLTCILFTVCDQPFVNAAHLNTLNKSGLTSPRGIIASGYGETFGVPILFKINYFHELTQLSGDEGAKKIANSHPNDLFIVPFPNGCIDIDTEQDYQALLKSGTLSQF